MLIEITKNKKGYEVWLRIRKEKEKVATDIRRIQARELGRHLLNTLASTGVSVSIANLAEGNEPEIEDIPLFYVPKP